MNKSTDRIEKQILLRAPLARVWRAISDAREFGSWFGIEFDGSFSPGARLTGRVTPTTVDPEVARLQEPHRGKTAAFVIDKVEPKRLFSFKWHPFAIDPAIDYSKEPMTLVEFVLREQSDGTLLTITESGFDQIPLARRAAAFEANDGGWTHQAQLIRKYLEREQHQG